MNDNQYKAVELTDEDLDKVSGGVEIEWEVKGPNVLTMGNCPGDCNGTKKSTCKVKICPNHYRGDGTMA